MSKSYFPKWAEIQGYYLRRNLRLSSFDTLDHLALAEAMKVKVLSIKDASAIPAAIVSHLVSNDRCGWSAGCLRLPEGNELRAVILYNPTHAITRQRATIMEELAHLHLKHKGSKLSKMDSGNGGFRSYNKSEESQAYFVGAAALLPVDVLKKARVEQTSRYEVARKCIVSEDLVLFREKITGVKLS